MNDSRPLGRAKKLIYFIIFSIDKPKQKIYKKNFGLIHKLAKSAKKSWVDA
jgi:hypothetical protein